MLGNIDPVNAENRSVLCQEGNGVGSNLDGLVIQKTQGDHHPAREWGTVSFSAASCLYAAVGLSKNLAQSEVFSEKGNLYLR
ncbi:MAG: hypothetical protein ACLR06_13335 [Christensenellaceae bacterium]